MSDEIQIGVTFTREQIEAWVGRKLTDAQIVDLEEWAPDSSIPEAFATMADQFEDNSEEIHGLTARRLAEMRRDLELEQISYGELLEIQEAFEQIDPATLRDRPENATAADMLDELEGRVTLENSVSMGGYSIGVALHVKRHRDDDGNPRPLEIRDMAECMTCHRAWCWTCNPTPASRCPFEYEHEDDES